MKKWIFIDTNIYLDFYRLRSVGKLLKSLEAVKDKIFIPEQVCNEVVRNRVRAAFERIQEDNKKLCINIIQLPDILTQLALTNDYPSFSQEWDEFEDKSKNLKKNYGDVLTKTICHIAKGIDPISESLEEIFKFAITHNESQITKARLRKELGNPPGKRGDPLGDQLSWEQLISTVNDEDDVWIVSRDSDYLFCFGKEITLNPYLYDEFVKQRSGNVFAFQDLSSALQHYKSYAEPMLDLPPPEDLDRATREQQEKIDASRESICRCPDGPTPSSGHYDNRFFVIQCVKCGVRLAVQEDFIFD
jgi:predicted nucleic acid-binding protein